MCDDFPFPRLENIADRNSKSWNDNVTDWEKILQKHYERLNNFTVQGTKRQVTRHIDRGMLLARDRMSLLLDPDAPFLEVCPFAGYGNTEGSICGTLIGGIGLVSGVLCTLFAHIPTLSGGSWTPTTVQKQNRIMQISMTNKLPLICLVHSAGVFLPLQFKVFHPGGQLFRDLARQSQFGVPSCSIVFGSSTAGGAYHPGMSDYTIYVQNQAMTALGGSALVEKATGEKVDAEELGGADMHSRVSGVSDFLARNEFEAVFKARCWAATLNKANHFTKIRHNPTPAYPIDDILGFVPTDIRKPVDMLQIVLRVVDGSQFEIFKPLYGGNLLTGWGYIHGRFTGIIANKSPVFFVQEAQKGTQFLRLCNSQNTPIIFLHNVTGFMVGAKTEREGIIKAGSQLINAVSNSTVPHIGVICGASYGAGNYAMCGRAYEPRFLFSWPIGRCSVMGPDQLGGVMEQIAKESAASHNIQVDEEEIRLRTAQLKATSRDQSSAYYTSGYLLDDGVIDPRDTRNVLGICLDAVYQQEIKGERGFRGVSRI